MLESQGLCIGPWIWRAPSAWNLQAHGEAPAPTRIVRAAADGAYLGFARLRAAPAFPRFWRWHRLEVLENEDASLVFTVRPRWSWLRRWDILDADYQRVGSFCSGRFDWPPDIVALWRLGTPADSGKQRYSGTLVEDWHGRILAWIEAPATRATARLIAPDGQLMGTAAQIGTDTVVEFTPGLDGKPFVKMALLAALLEGDGAKGRPGERATG
jgi:hypothetical protein